MAKKVKKEFQNAVQLDPSNIQARLDLMEYCVSVPWIVGGSKDEARAQIEAIEKLDPIEGHLAQGEVLPGRKEAGPSRERIPRSAGCEAEAH